MKTTSEVERSSEVRKMKYSRVRCSASPVVPFPVIILIISAWGKVACVKRLKEKRRRRPGGK
jgi:hypothetical protein